MSEQFATTAVGRYRDAHATDCLCGGAYLGAGEPRHFIWLAFIDDPTGRAGGGDGYLLSKAASLFGGTSIIHCQVAFYDAREACFVTYSADKAANVSVQHLKEFRNPAWRFVQVEVSRAQELAVWKFLIQQLDKPFDLSAVLLLYFWPRATTGDAWFCSELTLCALQSAGLALNSPPPHLTPPHKLYAYMTSKRHYRDTPCTLLNANPIALNARAKRGELEYVL